MTVAIIGGGITGLTAAYYLIKKGVPVLLFEPERLGGVIESTVIDGFTCESGPNVFLDKGPLLQLINELGLESKVRFPNIPNYDQQIYNVNKDKIENVPRSGVEWIFSDLLSWQEKITFIKRFFFTRLKYKDDVSVLDLLKNFLPESFIWQVVDPALKGIYGGEVSSLSGRMAFPEASHALFDKGLTLKGYLSKKRSKRPRIFTLEGGNHQLVEKLIPIVSGALRKERVISLLSEDKDKVKGFRIVSESGNYLVKEVYITTSGQASNFLATFPLEESLQKISHTPLTFTQVKVPSDSYPFGKSFGVLFPKSFDPFLGVMFNSLIFPHMAPLDKEDEKEALLTLSFKGCVKNDIEALISKSLSEYFGITKFTILHCKEWPRAIPQLTVGHNNHLSEIEEVNKKYPGLKFIGTDTGGIGVADRVAKAYAATATSFGCRSSLRKIGVLVAQLGTPQAPTPKALRVYLREFLSDPRVIEVNRVLWWIILNFIILTFRPRRSSRLYKRIWQKEGSPLLLNTESLTNKLRASLSRKPEVEIEFGMRYGKPTLSSVIDKLLAKGVDRILLVPLYPHYSAPTTASTYDAVFSHLLKRRVVPTLRVMAPYYDRIQFLNSVATRINEELSKAPPLEKLVLSYHGIPAKYVTKGDTYCCMCVETTRALIPLLSFPSENVIHTYQSRFGKDPWLTPYTDETVEYLAKGGIKSIGVASPGFTSDCLETLDELGNEASELFHEHGGETFVNLPCLNDHPVWVNGLSEMIEEDLRGWLDECALYEKCKDKVICPTFGKNS